MLDFFVLYMGQFETIIDINKCSMNKNLFDFLLTGPEYVIYSEYMCVREGMPTSPKKAIMYNWLLLGRRSTTVYDKCDTGCGNPSKMTQSTMLFQQTYLLCRFVKASKFTSASCSLVLRIFSLVTLLTWNATIITLGCQEVGQNETFIAP